MQYYGWGTASGLWCYVHIASMCRWEEHLVHSSKYVYSEAMFCLEPVFRQSFLHPSDKTDVLISEVYNIGQKMEGKVGVLNTDVADQFLHSLQFDEHGNLMGQLMVKGNTHSIRLNLHSKPSRVIQRREDQLKATKEMFFKLKKTILDNIVENIHDQNSNESWYYNWSGFDLHLPL